MRRIVFGLLLASHSWAAKAAMCASDLEVRVADELRNGGEAITAPTLFSACEPWPARPGTSIVVLATRSVVAPGKGRDDSVDIDLDIALVETASGRRRAHLRQARALKSDAWRLDGIGIDTARYAIAPDERAFGVRWTYRGASSMNPASNESLSLYVEDGDGLRRVLNALETYSYSGQWDQTCEGRFSEMRRAVDIAPGWHNGHSDLLIRETTAPIRNEPTQDGCSMNVREAETARLYTLRFDGSSYVIPAALERY